MAPLPEIDAPPVLTPWVLLTASVAVAMLLVGIVIGAAAL
jgi:multisubunit Na+/H+ antiporter MnhE subunit